MELRITLPPPRLGGNHEREHVGVMRYSKKQRRMVPGTRTFLAAEAVEYRARVAALVFVAMRTSGFEPPDAAKIDIEYFNIRLDRDNLHKTVVDALVKARVITASDYWVLAGGITRLLDDGPPRVEVVVTPVRRQDYDRRSKKRAAGKAASERPALGG